MNDFIATLTVEQMLVAFGIAAFVALVAMSRTATHRVNLRKTESARHALETEAARHEATLESRETALEQAVAERSDLRRRIGDLQEIAMKEAGERAALSSRLDAERVASEEKITLLSSVRKDMEDRFQQIADASLRQNGEELQKASRERLDAALLPLKEHVDRFQVELRNVHEGALKDRQMLKSEIETLTKRSEDVSREAVALTRALKGDKQRQGAWGEMILESLLERSGLRKGEEYEVQGHRVSEEGDRYRPDVVVRMPDGKRLVIDSKVSLVDYEICVTTEDVAEANAARLRHVAALRRHINTLSEKGYHAMEDGSVEYVVMFIPIEGALSEALRESGDLTGYAFEKNVTIATPTTLMMALRTISNVWTIERRNQNAEEIARRAGFLYDKVAGFVDAMDGIGKNLTQAQTSYGQAMDRLTRGSGNMLGQVEKLKDLGARTSKTMRVEFDTEDDQPRLTTDQAAE